jgi:SNF2 family DNA or RNA helicase
MASRYNNTQAISQHPDIKVKLFPHQLASVFSLEKLEREQFIETVNGFKETRLGVFADKSGYGKTLSIISLIVRDKMEWDMYFPYTCEIINTESAGLVKNRLLKRYDRVKPTLVLVDQSILKQWQDELDNTNLSVYSITSMVDLKTLDVNTHDVVLVVPSMYNKLVVTHYKNAWKRFIFDEPGHMRVSGMKEVIAGFYWFVTATPASICTTHRNCRGSYMKDIIGNGWWDFEYEFDGMIVKNDPGFIQESFNMPQTIHIHHECFQPIYNTINSFVTPNILTMIEAGNIEGAIHALGGHKTGNIVELIKHKKYVELEEIESKIRIHTMRNDSERITKWENRLIVANNQLKELDSKFEERLQGICSICLDKVKSPILEPACQNLFCGECILTWFKKSMTCPLCKACVDKSSLVYIDTKEKKDTKQEIITEKRPVTKLDKIGEIITNNPEGKFLIFSAYDESFTPICTLLNEKNIPYSQIKGNLKSKQQTIDLFKSGGINVIFLNSNYCGSGINLQEATDVILYHDMTTNMENQILGRANRIGRNTSLKVHYLKIKQ